MLTAYFDVSGDRKHTTRAYALAGFGGPVSNWLRFEREWKATMSRVGLMPKGLHMAEFHAARKRGNVSENVYAHVMLQLHDCLKRDASISIARVIDGEDLETILKSGKHPLVLAGLSAMEAVDKWRHSRARRRRRRVEPFELIFHRGEKGKDALADATPFHLPCPIPKSSQAAVPLQAADWLAWELSQLNLIHVQHRGHGGEKVVAVRGEVWAAQRSFARDWKYYDNGSWKDIIRPRSATTQRPETGPPSVH